MSLKVFALVFLAEVCGALMNVLFKQGIDSLDNMEEGQGWAGYGRYFKKVLSRPQIWLGIASILCGLILWFAALAQVDLSLAFPMNSLEYILILGASYFFLSEPLDKKKIAGTLLIVLGIVLVNLGHLFPGAH